jgi:hypothetical protein
MTSVSLSDLGAQRKYIEELTASGYEFDIVQGSAFVAGMKATGYRSTAHALFELVDNSAQAGASNIHIAFDSPTAPRAIAVIDDAHGMETGMLRTCLAWGGTHRAGAKRGYGKFGFGLSSASISIGNRVDVYSVVEGGPWQMTYLDLDEIAKGTGSFTDRNRLRVPEPVRLDLPTWVLDYIEENFEEPITHGTVVVMSNLAKLRYSGGAKLTQYLQENLGVTFRNSHIPMKVNGHPVDPIDPLFITPSMRYYALDSDHAIALPPKRIEVEDSGGVKHVVTVRFARMPASFFRKPGFKDNVKPPKTGMWDQRLNVAAANNGLIITREGRQIDVLGANRSKRFSLNSTTDRFWAVEIDFPSSLDDEFSITNSKQQAVMSDRMWDILKANGVVEAIGQMRGEYKREAQALIEQLRKQKADEKARQQASEEAIRNAQRFKARRAEPTEAQAAAGAEALEEAVAARVAATGKPAADVRAELEAQAKERPYQVRTESVVEGPFYRIVQEGGVRVLWINTAHRFYSALYGAADTTDQTRSALETLLWVLGESELETTDEYRTFIRSLRVQIWSPNLDIALAQLEEYEPDEAHEIVPDFAAEDVEAVEADGEEPGAEAVA